MENNKIQRLYKNNASKIKNLENIQKQKLSEHRKIFFDIDFLGNFENTNFSIHNVKNKLQQRLKNAILIKLGEIPFKSSFGSTIYNNLYLSDKEINIIGIKNEIEKIFKEIIKDDAKLDDISINKRDSIDETYNNDFNRIILDVKIAYSIPIIGNDLLYLSLMQYEQPYEI